MKTEESNPTIKFIRAVRAEQVSDFKWKVVFEFTERKSQWPLNPNR